MLDSGAPGATVRAMPTTARRANRKLRKLPRAAAAGPADQPRAEARGGPDPRFDAAWKAEIRRRIADIKSGREKGISGDEVRAKTRKLVGL